MFLKNDFDEAGLSSFLVVKVFGGRDYMMWEEFEFMEDEVLDYDPDNSDDEE